MGVRRPRDHSDGVCGHSSKVKASHPLVSRDTCQHTHTFGTYHTLYGGLRRSTTLWHMLIAVGSVKYLKRVVTWSWAAAFVDCSRACRARLRPPGAEPAWGRGTEPGRGRASASPPALYPVEEHAKDQHGGEVGGRMQRVPEGAGRDDHREHLARGHHDGEDHRPESADGIVDEELARGRGDRDQHIVPDGGGVLLQEL